MVKKKGGRDMNPVDAFRKSQRAKEISKNKKGRQLQREATAQISDPTALRSQLKEILDAEQAGEVTPALRLRKKAVQQAYDQAIKKQMEKEAAEQKAPAAAAPIAIQGPESLLPPLPAFPSLPIYGAPPIPLPHAPPPFHTDSRPNFVLPPPPGPPPQPPHAAARMQPRPPSHASTQRLLDSHAADVQPVIAAKSTVVALPKAQHDKRVTSMVPASVLTRRPQKRSIAGPARQKIGGQGFGLVPAMPEAPAQTAAAPAPVPQPVGKGESEADKDSFESFMDDMRKLGAV